MYLKDGAQEKAPQPKWPATPRAQGAATASPRPPVQPGPAPASLNDYPASESIGLLMRIALFGLRASFKAELVKHRVPWSAWHYLRVLYEHDGISQRELTERVGAMQPNTVSVLQTMGKAGWVTIARGADRRRTVVSLTQKGRKLMARMLPEIRMVVKTAWLDGFTDQEEAELRRLLNKVCDNVRSAASAENNSGDAP